MSRNGETDIFRFIPFLGKGKKEDAAPQEKKDPYIDESIPPDERFEGEEVENEVESEDADAPKEPGFGWNGAVGMVEEDNRQAAAGEKVPEESVVPEEKPATPNMNIKERNPGATKTPSGDKIERNLKNGWPFNKSKGRLATKEELEPLAQQGIGWARQAIQSIEAGSAPSFVLAQNQGGVRQPERAALVTPTEAPEEDTFEAKKKRLHNALKEIQDKKSRGERVSDEDMDALLKMEAEGEQLKKEEEALKQPVEEMVEEEVSQEKTRVEKMKEYVGTKAKEIGKEAASKLGSGAKNLWEKALDMPSGARATLGFALFATVLITGTYAGGWVVVPAAMKALLSANSAHQLWRKFLSNKSVGSALQLTLAVASVFFLIEMGLDGVSDAVAATEATVDVPESPAPMLAEDSTPPVVSPEDITRVDVPQEESGPVFLAEDTTPPVVSEEDITGVAPVAEIPEAPQENVVAGDTGSLDESVYPTETAEVTEPYNESEVVAAVPPEVPVEVTPETTPSAEATPEPSAVETPEETAEDALAILDNEATEAVAAPEAATVEPPVETEVETAPEPGAISAEALPQELSVEARPGDGAITMLMHWAETAHEAGQTFPDGSPMSELLNSYPDGLYDTAQRIAIEEGLYQPNEVAESFNVELGATLGTVTNPDGTVSFSLANPSGESHTLWSSGGGDAPAYSGENMIDTAPDTSVAESRLLTREETEALAQDVASRNATGGVELSVDEAKEAAPKVLQDAADTQDLVAGTVQNAIAIQGEVAGLSGEAWGTLSNLPLPDVFSDPAATEAMRTQALMDLAWDNGIALGEEGADHLEHMIAMMQSPDMGATYGVVATTDSDGMRSIADIFADGFRNRETGG